MVPSRLHNLCGYVVIREALRGLGMSVLLIADVEQEGTTVTTCRSEIDHVIVRAVWQ